MVTLYSSLYFNISHLPISRLSSNSLFPILLVISPPKREHPLKLKSKKLKQKKQNQLFLGMCKKWEGESDPALELQVLEFMKKSKNPSKFPSKKELFEGGRADLVEAIVSRGGWMCVGWQDEEINEYGLDDMSFSLEKYDKDMSFRIENYDENGDESNVLEFNEGKNVEDVSFLGNSSQGASSSGRSIEVEEEEDSGIEGILHRLEKQRNLSLGINLNKNGSSSCVSRDFDESGRLGTLKNADSRHPKGSEPTSYARDRPMFSDNGSSRSHSSTMRSSTEANTWRSWSIQRAGFSDKEFEAAEIDFGRNTNERSVDETIDVKENFGETKDLSSVVRDIGQSDVKVRLQLLETELSKVLHSLRSKATDLPEKAEKHSSEDLRQLSDASEFQENEIMNSQDKLRSIHAKLAVLEGKMALAIIDAQKILDDKQKRIDDARHALQLLHTICIVWPSSGSEVLLAGSFDGWATKRKMERSSAGNFFVNLKLYPGKYEIKFVVDGVWMVDPLRPIVNNNGFENNLLIIS